MVPVPKTAAPDVDARVALIQALIPVALDRVYEELKAEVERLAGERYRRDGRPPGHVRWTSQRGSIYLADPKIPIEVPRVRDRLRNVEVPLPIYERLQEPRACDLGLLHKVLGGLSTREDVCRSGARRLWAQRVDGVAALYPSQRPQAAGIE